MNNRIPRVGDLVRLNDTGLKSAFGSTVGVGFMKSKLLRVVSVGPKSLVNGADIREIKVDDKDISIFLLHTGCFDIVETH